MKRTPVLIGPVFALLVAGSGCIGEMQVPDEMVDDPRPAIESGFDAIVHVFNEDLGPEGESVSRSEVQSIFQDDPTLLGAVLSDVGGSSAAE